MRITYDPEADYAYIYLVDDIRPGEATSGSTVVDGPHGVINVDFDSEGRLLGIEVQNPRKALRPEYFTP
jgi:uncharacterized protein YuzE